MAHPFHIHGALFRILSIGGTSPPAHLAGWKDVVLVEDSAELLVAFNRPATRDHPFMYHCHILEHEEAGLMDNTYPASRPGHASSTHYRYCKNGRAKARSMDFDRFCIIRPGNREVTLIVSAAMAATTSFSPGLSIVRARECGR